MKTLSFTSLRVQAVLWTLLPLTIIFLVVGSVGVYAYSEVVSRLVYDRDRELARTNAARLSENLDNHAAVLQALADNRFMRTPNFGSQKGVLQTSIERGLLKGFDGGITVFDARGKPLLTASTLEVDVGHYQMAFSELPDQSYEAEPFFRVARDEGRAFFSNILEHLGEPRILVSYPIVDQEGDFIGVLAGAFLLKNAMLGEEIRKLGVGTAYLVDESGQVIWHGNETFIGQDFSDRDPVRDLLDPAVVLPAHRGTDEAGKTVVFGSAVVDSTGWGLIIQEEWDTVIGPVRTFQWMMLGTLAVGLMLVMVIISIGTSRLTEPIRELVSQTQQLAHGEFVGEVGGGSVDEMRSLSDAFNEMADRVARYRAGLQSYVAAITHSQEEERKRIARELHDDTIQSLIALGRRLEMMEQSLENPIEAAKQLYQLEQLLTQTVAEVRQFSRDLRPLLLEDLGLEAAIRQMLREMERRDPVQTTLAIEGEVPPGGLDDELEVSMYRIAQEALNNIRKHAQAGRVDVTLGYHASSVSLSVRDDGRGFPVSETSDLARRGAFGLMGIRERAHLFGGTFEIGSTPGEGTQVEVRLPLSVAPEWVLEELRGVAAQAALS